MAIGTYNGSLKGVSATDLGAAAVREGMEAALREAQQLREAMAPSDGRVVFDDRV
jgi:hypothetical protein